MIIAHATIDLLSTQNLVVQIHCNLDTRIDIHLVLTTFAWAKKKSIKYLSLKAVWYIPAIFTHKLVCVPLSLGKSGTVMSSPSKATFIVNVSEDIDDIQNIPDPVSVSVSWSMDMHWYRVWINQLVVYERSTRVHPVRQEMIWIHWANV